MARLHYLHEQRHIHSNWLVTRKTRSVSAGRRELGVGVGLRTRQCSRRQNGDGLCPRAPESPIERGAVTGEKALRHRWAGPMIGREKCIGRRRSTQALSVTSPSPPANKCAAGSPHCYSAAALRASNMALGAEGGPEGVESPKSGALKGFAWSRLDGMGTAGTGVRAREGPVATAKGGQEHGTRGRGSNREEDDRGTLSGPKS